MYVNVISEASNEGSTWQKFKIESPKSIPYKVFHHLYYITAISVNSPKEIIEQGTALLPKVWAKFKRVYNSSKEKIIIAFVYLLHIQNNILVPLKSFLCKLKIDPSGVVKYIKLLQVLLNFKSAICSQNHEEFRETIALLVNSMFLKANPKLLQDTEKLANGLAALIHEKHWISIRSKNYCVIVSTCATVIAGRSAAMDYTGRDAHGKRKTFHKNFIDINKIFELSGVYSRTMQRHIKSVMEDMFVFAKKMPWKPNHVKKYSDVPYIAEEIVRFCDIDIENSEILSSDLPAMKDIAPVRSVFTKALVSFLELDSTESNPSSKSTKFNVTLFFQYLKENFYNELTTACHEVDVSSTIQADGKLSDECKQIKEENENDVTTNVQKPTKSKDMNISLSGSQDDIKLQYEEDSASLINASEREDNKIELQEELDKKRNFESKDIIKMKKNCLIINDVELSYYHILLVKDLLNAGCTPFEIEQENYIDLVKKYLDPIALKDTKGDASDNSCMSDHDNEIDGYLYTEREITDKLEAMNES